MPVPELFNKYRKLVDLRSNWESHWQEIADYVLPKRADVNKERSRGDKRTELIYDCLLYTSPSPRDYAASRMPSSA